MYNNEANFEFKTSVSLFGSSHLQHISDGNSNSKKEFIQHFNDFSGIKLPDNKKGVEMLNKSNGMRTVPQIFVGDQHIGGNDELQTLENQGKLDNILGL